MKWWHPKAREYELDCELQSHLDLETEEQRAAGLPPGLAHRAAQRAFGNTTFVAEATRETWGGASWERLLQDLRYSVRVLRKSPGFTTVAVLSLALGIGANTAIFTLLNAVVLRNLPVPNPQQLVEFTYTFPSNGPDNWNSWFGYPQFERFRDKAGTLSGLFAGVGLGRVNVGYRGVSALAQGQAWSDGAFAVLGITPQRGRFLAPGDDGPDASAVVLSDRFWRSHFSADPSIVGNSVTINQLNFTVIGIAPPDFHGISVGSGPDLWVPLHALDRFNPNPGRWTESFTSWIQIAGRVRPGIARERAQAELDVIHRQLLAEQISVSGSRGSENMQRFVRESHLVLRPAEGGVNSGLRHQYELPLELLMAVASIVLLVACANVANLMLARASNRRREIAVRLALGAGRARVMRQLLTESLLLSAMGGAAAIALAWWGSALLVRMISTGDTPIPLDVQPDWRIFGFTAAVSLATGLLFGLAPALRGTRVDPGPAIKGGSRQTTHSSRVMDRLLVITQVALSALLIAGAAMFVRTLQNLWNVDMGFDRENVLMFSVDARLAGYSRDRLAPVYRDILQRLQTLPEVRTASASRGRPVDDNLYLVDGVREVDGRKLPERDTIRVAWNVMSPGYFATVAMPVLLGRDFDVRDDQNAPKVVVVNEALARRALPGQNPIGHRLGDATIVGVVKDSHHNGVRDQPRPVLYRPLFQSDLKFDVSFEIRYRSSAGLKDNVRREVASVDRNLTAFRVKTLREQTQESLLRERLLASLSSFFGGLALLLACLGLYGLMAYAVVRRTAEIGIRMAVGARRGHVLWLVLRETFGLALCGIAIGIPLAAWAARYAKSLLFGVTSADPRAIALSAAALLGVAALAGYLPARRALRVDPTTALRYE